MGDALHQPVGHGVPGANEDDGNCFGQLESRVCGCIAIGQQHIRRKPQRPLGRSLHPGRVTRAPLKIDLKVTADAPTGLL